MPALVTELSSIAPARSHGQKTCEAEGLDFAETFAGHFLLTRSPVEVPESWDQHDLEGWSLARAPDLPLVRLVTNTGQLRGFLLGLAVDWAGTLLADQAVVDGDFSAVEDWCLSLAGRYVAILADTDRPHLYCDAGGSLVTLYNPSSQRAGSSLALLVDDSLDPRFEDGVLPQGEWLLFGDTMDRRVMRMQSNHALDLSTFALRRVWPRDDTLIDPPTDYQAHLDGMVARQRQILAALAKCRRVVLPVTGGSDSRFLMACMPDDMRNDAAYYVHVQNKSSFLDSLVATSLCEKVGVPLATLSLKSPGAPQGEALERIRCMVRISGSFQVPDLPHVLSAAHLPRPLGDTLLRGGLVEMTRANKWLPEVGDSPDRQIEPDVGVRALGHPFPMSDEFVAKNSERYADWLDGLPAHLRGRAIDFAHCEI